MKKWKAIIFDMDGTLFDTEMISRLAWISAGRKYNLPISEEFMLKLIGLTPSNAQRVYDTYMPRGWPQEDAFTHHEEFIQEYRMKYGVPMKGDLHLILSTLKKQGYQIGLATSARYENMMFNLESSKVLPYFEVALSAERMEKGKPDPDIYFKTMKELNVQPQNCMIIEDSFNGVRAAYTSGASVVMIPDLVKPNEEIKDMCNYVLKGLEELLPLLK